MNVRGRQATGLADQRQATGAAPPRRPRFVRPRGCLSLCTPSARRSFGTEVVGTTPARRPFGTQVVGATPIRGLSGVRRPCVGADLCSLGKIVGGSSPAGAGGPLLMHRG